MHFAIPPNRAWQNVHQHCSMVLAFRSREDTLAWCDRQRSTHGEDVPLHEVAQFARTWYGTHANENWHKWTIAEAQAIFDLQPVPQFHPGREALAVVCGLFVITLSVALLFRSTVAIASRALFLFLIAWLCLKVPAGGRRATNRRRLDRILAKSECCWPADGCCLHAYLSGTWARSSGT